MFKKIIIAVFCTISFGSLIGCASIVNGTNQPVSVHTGEAHGATCSLENDKGRWYINRTPGSVVVNRSFKDLKIQCMKKGFEPTYTKVKSKTKGMAFGNILFGGVVGAGVDMVDGAAYDYPSEIIVPMKRNLA